VSTLIFPAYAGRITTHSNAKTEPVQSLQVVPSGDDGVDWHFMTKEFSFAGRQEQDTYDVVQGHSCQKVGNYDDSYSASSLCYWHPDTEHAAPQGWGLRWRGGVGGSEWCTGLAKQSGVCAKCTLCHDNARDRDAAVDVVGTRVEILPLPVDCMKESHIEAECLNEFRSNNGDISKEDFRCNDVQQRYNEAVSALNEVNAVIESSSNAITENTRNIAQGQVDFGILIERERRLDAETRQLHMRALTQCRAFIPSVNFIDVHELIRRSPRCDVEGMNSVEEMNCEICTQSVSRLRRQIDVSEVNKNALISQRNTLQNTLYHHGEDLEAARQRQAAAYQDLSSKIIAKESLDQEWLPQQADCVSVIAQALDARNNHMMVCPRRFYDVSCEKACVEIQTQGDHGCGVIEGSEDGDPAAKGGVEVTCQPPAPSWIMVPSNYGAIGQGDAEQCERITANQGVRRTTPVVMSGWMEKTCYRWCFGKNRRFFVLESGNGVRSAALRYWKGDPKTNGVERTNKGIELWDAGDVRIAETSEKQACFEIHHQYRGRITSWLRSGTSYTICVLQEDYEGQNVAEIRDMWVENLQQMLVWRPRVA